MEKTFGWVLLLAMCVGGDSGLSGVLFHKSDVVHNQTSWYQTPLLDYPALEYVVEFKISFPLDDCCPLLSIFANEPANYSYVTGGDCVNNSATEGTVYWFSGTTFVLSESDDADENPGNCRIKNGLYVCNITTHVLHFEPKNPWLVFCYECNAKKLLVGLKYEYIARGSNTTECEEMHIPDNEDFYFQCDRFYQYVAFPNVFGHTLQKDALTYLQLFQIIVENLEIPCHQHLDYMICQAFFPRCPDHINAENKTTAHLLAICEEMCWEAFGACNDSMQPVINYFDCAYYTQTSNLDLECWSEEVLCESPPPIEHGKATVSSPSPNPTYKVGASAQYSCDRDYRLSGNGTALCGYSGFWLPIPHCNSIIPIKILIAACLLLVLIIASAAGITCFCKRRRERRRRAKYFENQPYEKRTRDHDAFISFTSDSGPDYDFVRHLHNSLEMESDPPFKLFIHSRDFHADTLIYVNIRRAVENSNSAIIVMSQDYVNSRWCREEFEECVEENSKDPAYKLFVILMQPQESLKRYTAYMDKYFRSKTYLNKEDPQLLQKLQKYLLDVKKEET